MNQIQLIEKKAELETVFFSGRLTTSQLGETKKEIRKLGKQIEPTPTHKLSKLVESWGRGNVEYYFMSNFQGVLSKKQAYQKIAEAENHGDDFQIVVGQSIERGNFLSVHNAKGED